MRNLRSTETYQSYLRKVGAQTTRAEVTAVEMDPAAGPSLKGAGLATSCACGNCITARRS